MPAEQLQPDLNLAAALFDSLSRTTRVGAGIVRDSYGTSRLRTDIMRSAAEAIGLEVSIDAIGNLMMTLRGRERLAPGIIVGIASRQRTAGGNYDGAAGVVAGLSALSALRRAGIEPACDITVMASARRNPRGSTSPISAAAVRSGLARSRLPGDPPLGQRPQPRSDSARARLRPAGDTRAAPTLLDPARIRAYLELHIEQGPTLVAEGLPAAAVTGIRGCVRFRNARCLGRYAHSGAVNRPHRHDAVAATVAWLHHLETVWLQYERERRGSRDHLGGVDTDAAMHRPQQDCRRDSFRHRHSQRVGCDDAGPRR